MSVQHAPVFKDTFRMVNLLIDYMENMAVRHRRTLGDRILDTGYGLLETLHFAYGDREKRDYYLNQYQMEFATLQTYLRIANERGWIPLKHRTNIAELEAKISIQIGAWKKSIKK